MEDLSGRWLRCKEGLNNRLGEDDRAGWLQRMELIRLDREGAVFEGIPNSYLKNRILERFLPLLRESLQAEFTDLDLPDNLAVTLHVSDPLAEEPEIFPSADSARAQKPEPEFLLDPKFRFDTFLEGQENQLPLKFAREVIEAPGTRYNPLFLVGGVGTGKTHLLQAMARQLKEADPQGRILYLTSETFTNEVITGIRTRQMAGVRERFRSARALLLDDVDFIKVSGRAQEELLHTFDAIKAKGAQLVFSAGVFPREITSLDPTLRSRMEAGLVVELHPMDTEARMKLILRLAGESSLPLSQDMARLLATRITTGARQIEGALVRLAAYSSMGSHPLNLDFLLRTASPFFDRDPAQAGIPISDDLVLGTVADHFGLTMKILRSRDNSAKVSKARRVAAYLLRELGGLSLPEIGAALGNRTHSTIIQSLKTLGREMEENFHYRQAIQQLRDDLIVSARS